jgi:hypothetical protein
MQQSEALAHMPCAAYQGAMNPLIRLLVIAAILAASALPSFAWTGPQTSIVNKNGRKVLKICDQGGSCTTSTPFFLALNSQTTAVANHDWTTFLYQAQLQLSYANAGPTGLVPIVQVHLLTTADAFLDELATKLNQLSSRPYLYVRLYLEAPPTGFERMKMANLQGQLQDDTGAQGAPFSMSAAWLTFQENQIARVLNRLDVMYPGRVLGLNIAYGSGGEWLTRPAGYDAALPSPMLDWGADNLCATGLDGVTKCNLFPWSNDSATQPGPIGRHQFYLEDYSPTTELGFCSWSALPTILRSSCRSATVVERNNAVPGQPLPTLGLARGVFLDPADTGSLRAAYYNRYISEQNVAAIIRILAKAKQVTGNRLLTSVFYGYLYGLRVEQATSGHAALSTLLTSPSIDIVAGPYSYAYSRALGSPFSAQGPTDSPKLANKLWFDEDDTRTHLAGGIAFQTVTNLWDSIRILRRNLLTAGLHDRGSWFLDLVGTGWFGRPDRASDSDSLWANLVSAFMAIHKIQLNAPNRFDAQVAVFTDDVSSAYVAGLSPAGDNSFALTTDLATNLIDSLSRLGTPVKQYLLSDLLRSNLDLSAVKLAVFSNAWNVSSSVRAAIDAKLKTPGRTLLFVYAAGYLNQDAPASVASMASLTGISVALGAGTPALSESFNVTGATVLGGPDYPLTPWFRITDAAATALGTYRFAGGTSLARKAIAVTGGSYTSVVAAAPSLPLDVLRKLSEDAGVFHFTAKGDIVEAAGNMMFVHAATTGFKTINFPQTMPRIFETALWPSDTLMCSNCAALSQLPFNDGDTRAFRWSSRPVGNFELISGTTLIGWAADLDTPETSIAVHAYIGGPLGVGSFLAGFSATSARPDVGAFFGIPGNNGFSHTLASCPSGSPIYAYALDPESGGDGVTLIGVHNCP